MSISEDARWVVYVSKHNNGTWSQEMISMARRKDVRDVNANVLCWM
jgi:hypothetical protein